VAVPTVGRAGLQPWPTGLLFARADKRKFGERDALQRGTLGAAAAMSNARYSQPSGQMRCGWAVDGIFENQFAAKVSMNSRQFRKVTLNLNFYCTVIPRLTKIICSGITFVSRNVTSCRFL